MFRTVSHELQGFQFFNPVGIHLYNGVGVGEPWYFPKVPWEHM